MQYGRFRTKNLINVEFNSALIGKLLEQEFEQKGIPIELPTVADWGYTFRAKVGRKFLDISVVDHDEDGFGIAVEQPKDIFSRFFTHESTKALEGLKLIVSKVLALAASGSTLTWYSKDEWLAAFDTEFWQHQN